MTKIRKIVIAGLVMLSAMTSFGFCAGEINPNPPHSIAKPSQYSIVK